MAEMGGEKRSRVMLFHLRPSLGTQHQLESLMTRLVHLLGPTMTQPCVPACLTTDIQFVIMNIWPFYLVNSQTTIVR